MRIHREKPVSIRNFVPEVWSATIETALRKKLVYAGPEIVNRDYEGEISQVGDAVRIGQIGDVTISTYTKNTDIAAPSALTDAQMTLIIDQGKYFSVILDSSGVLPFVNSSFYGRI